MKHGADAKLNTQPVLIPATTSASRSWSTNFNTASALAVALSRLGKIFNVLQLTPGHLEATSPETTLKISASSAFNCSYLTGNAGMITSTFACKSNVLGLILPAILS